MAEIEVPFWKPYVTWDMVKDRWEGLIRAGKLSGGRIGAYHENVQQLEEKVAKLHDRKYGVATHSGSGALMLAISELARRSDSQIIISPAFTFGAIPHIAKLLGMGIVYGDIHPERWTMDRGMAPRDVELISGRGEVGVVVPVCMFGNRPFWGASTDPRPGVYDAAHGVGTDLGLFDPVCLSFSPGKLLTTAEGGMVLTDDEELAATLREMAFKLSRMSEFEASYGLAMLEALPHIRRWKKELADYYRSALGDLLVFQERLASTNNYQSCCLASNERERDFIIKFAREKGIQILAYYESLSPSCPTAVDVGKRVLALPSWVPIPAETQRAVVDVILSAVETFRRSAPS